jgi:hypothetical protein
MKNKKWELNENNSQLYCWTQPRARRALLRSARRGSRSQSKEVGARAWKGVCGCDEHCKAGYGSSGYERQSLRRRWRVFRRFFGWPWCLRRNDENGCSEVERRQDRSRGGCWGDVGAIGSVLASSAQLKRLETVGSAWFWVKMGDISIFWWFLVKPGTNWCVSRAVAMLVSAGDSVCGCDSKSAHESALFWCSVRCGVSGELATVGRVMRCEMTSLGVWELV